jgi:hypothetical protein
MANEMQSEEEAKALPVNGASGPEGKPASVAPSSRSEQGKLPYSPPTLKSLGKVAELTFGGAGSLKDVGVRPSKKG